MFSQFIRLIGLFVNTPLERNFPYDNLLKSSEVLNASDQHLVTELNHNNFSFDLVRSIHLHTNKRQPSEYAYNRRTDNRRENVRPNHGHLQGTVRGKLRVCGLRHGNFEFRLHNLQNQHRDG